MENSTYQKVLADTTQMYEKKISELVKQLQDEHAHFECPEEQLGLAKKLLSDHQNSIQVNFISYDKLGYIEYGMLHV
jgi:kinesin family protein 5